MRILVLLLMVASPASASRVNSHAFEQKTASKVNEATMAELSSEQTSQVHRGTELLESLKLDVDNKELQEEYRNLIGEIEWSSEEERAIFANEGSLPGDLETETLGSEAIEGDAYKLVELLKNVVGRFFANRRDYVVEGPSGPKYWIDGTTLSLHNRMHVFMGGDGPQIPRYVIRRAFNYLNPIARTVGQYVYRVIECTQSTAGLTGGCEEGKYLYTITKDRLGRGLLWGHQEWRVFPGTGGCTRYGFGLLGCSMDQQIIYSITGGIPQASWNAKYYEGQIRYLSTNGDGARLQNRRWVHPSALHEMKIAETDHVSGSPRALNWVAGFTGFSGLLSAVKELMWVDTFSLRIEKPYPDDLLLMILCAFQEITRRGE